MQPLSLERFEMELFILVSSFIEYCCSLILLVDLIYVGALVDAPAC